MTEQVSDLKRAVDRIEALTDRLEEVRALFLAIFDVAAAQDPERAESLASVGQRFVDAALLDNFCETQRLRAAASALSSEEGCHD